MKNIKTICFIATILMVFAVSCEKEEPIIDDHNNVTDHGQFDTLLPITIHYIFDQSISPGGTSSTTIEGYKE